ncbi:ATP-binding protein [Patescibacteria group bacterium]|nr:ATP-binding protein [Patescibacteria group bacterium]
MIPIFIATGHSGSGKSTLLRFAKQAFQNYGLFSETVTDRDLLSQAVAQDMAEGYEELEVGEGKLAKVSAHAVLYRDHHDPGLRVFTVRDGLLLNRVHQKMRDLVFDYRDESGLVVEWTTGPNVHEFPVLPTGEEELYQDGNSIVELFAERRLGDGRQVLMVAVNTDLEQRIERNLRRPDPMDPDDFSKIFRDGGELRQFDAAQFPKGVFFHEYENNYDDEARFFQEMREMCGREAQRLFEGGWVNRERQKR